MYIISGLEKRLMTAKKVQTISKFYISIKNFEYFFELINNFP